MKIFRNSVAALFVSIVSVISLHAQDVVITGVSTTPVSCGGVWDGTITITVTGGVGMYTYLLVKNAVPMESSGPISSQTYTFTGQSKFPSYIIIVSDEEDATGDAFTFASIGGPDPISITSAFATDISCNGAGDGTIEVTAIGEEGNFLFDLTGPVNRIQENGIFTGLSQGDYTVTVSDRDGCPSTDVTPVLTIQNPSAITVTVDQVVDMDCYGESTGSIAITPGGGTPSGTGTGYTYQWTGPNGFIASSEDIAGLESGNYFVTVYDGNMCAASVGPVSVSQPPEISSILTGTGNVTCNGGNDGSAAIDVTGGVGGYAFQWEGQATGLIRLEEDPVDLVADVYNLTVSDGNNCSRTWISFATIDEPDPISVNVDDTDDVLCHGDTDGSAGITPSGGTPPYSFLWTGTSSGYSSTDEDPAGMPADNYSLTITDANSCNEQFPDLLVIGEPDPILVLLDGTTHVSCFGGNDGSADITVTGGTPPFTFQWTGDVSGHISTVEDPGDLPADTYDLVITDANGCTRSLNDVTISQPAELTVNVDQIIHVDCFGEATGSIDITLSGGTPPYTFFWTTPGGFTATSQNLSNLEAGIYSLTVTDAQGCSYVFADLATVTENTLITANFDLTDISCSGGSDGAIDATVSEGVPPYSYDWTGPSGFHAVTEDLTTLAAGDYRFTVTDALGCIRVFPDQTLTAPPALDAEATWVNVDCFGAASGSADLTPSGGTPPYTFAWTGPSGFTAATEDLSALGPGNYSVTITDAHLCTAEFTDIVSITQPPEITVSADRTDITCGGLTDGAIDITVSGGTPAYSFSWTGPGGFESDQEDIAGLAAGSYTLTLTDANGCVVTFTDLETILEPPPIVATYVSHQDVLCNGDAGGSIQIDVTGGTPPLAFEWTNGTGATLSVEEDPGGLPAGTYSLTITDANGCSAVYPDMVTITEPAPVSVSLAGTNILCYGDGDGTITVTASGGTPPYRYSRLGNLDPAYQDGNQFTGLDPGFYTIWTRDANLCVVTDTITIHESAEIEILEETVTGEILCFGDSSVRISIDAVTGGVAPYEYSINGGLTFQTGSAFDDLPAGNYQTRVRDALGCTADGASHEITQPAGLGVPSLTIEPITTCYDSREGRIILTGAGGTGTLAYTLNDTLEQASGDFRDLPGGVHTVIIEDENGCTLDTGITILAPDEILVTGMNITHVTGCSGDFTGAVSVTGTGGTGSLSFALDSGPFQSAGNFSGLAAGPHTVTLKDERDCIRDTAFTLTEPAPISIIAESVSDITCAGFDNGSVQMTVTGGTSPLTYSLDPGGLSNATGMFGGLSPGIYTVTVDDAEGCGPVPSSPMTVNEPPQMVLDSLKTGPISCHGSHDGRISIYVSGGIPPYEYSVDNQSTWNPDSVSSGLAPGNYEVFIRDANFCLLYGGSITFTDPPELTLAVTSTHITTCAGDTSGVITALAAGGTGDHYFSLDGISYQDSGDFHHLPAGNYTVYVEDEQGCSVTAPATINEPDPLVATISKTDATFGNLGSITISDVSGGTPPYVFGIEGSGGPFSTDTVYSLLEADTYHVVIQDQNGCTYEELVHILDVLPLDVSVIISHVSCYGADDGRIEIIPQDAVGETEYSIDSGYTFVSEALFTDLPGNVTYYLVARDEEGKVFTGPATVIEPAEITLMRNITPAECNAFSETGAIDITVQGGTGTCSYLWSDGSTAGDRFNLAAGTYILEITDANNCTRVDTIYVNSLVIVHADAGADTILCPGGSVRLNGQGGHIPSWEPAIFLSDPGIADPVATGVTQPVTYVLTITEEVSPYGCYNRDSVTLDLYPLTGIDATEDTFLIVGNSLQLDVTGGPFNDYRWEPSTGLNDSSIPDPVASPVESILYFVFGTNQYGCEESDSVFIEVIEDIRAYNVFSPNGDGVNDFFDIENAARFPDMVVEVYSRWGDKLFSSKGYDDGSRWDGTARGKDVPVGTYYYVIIPYSGAKPITGNVTIIR
ncbi:MAG TPA: T9SS type B sorting domain-containing protein [Bacteroides sp.]|nr:T9SS type B sorting domain-containing protein [Bacteroides sp.]